MADDGSLPSPTPDKNNRKPTSFPRLFTTLKGFSETELPVMSPTSILDISKPFSALRNPFWSESNSHTPKIPEPETRLKLASKGIGLGIVDVLEDDKSQSKESKPETRMVLFGSQLKIQIPPLVPSPQDSPKSPAEFGIKTRNSQLGSFSSVLSPATAKKSTFGSINSGPETPNSPQLFTGCLSATEMELSEDYTCVISHGPNPKTTHIFDNCIIENCCGSFSPVIKEKNGFTVNSHISYPSESFLSFCYACKKNLVEGKDIYMYRGDKAFCSRECRFHEMMLEKEAEELGPDDVYGTCS